MGEAALGDAAGLDETPADVDQNDVKLLSFGMGEGSHEVVDTLRVEDAVAALRRGPRTAPAELEGGRDGSGAGRAEPSVLLQLVR